jgi:hypothetical protein
MWPGLLPLKNRRFSNGVVSWTVLAAISPHFGACDDHLLKSPPVCGLTVLTGGKQQQITNQYA